jgi:hypothetical protein
MEMAGETDTGETLVCFAPNLIGVHEDDFFPARVPPVIGLHPKWAL